MTKIECNRCDHFMAGGGDVACMVGSYCPTGCGGKMCNPAKCMPWDEPERLAFYGVDPGDHGNRERAEAVEIDAEGDLTASGYWR